MRVYLVTLLVMLSLACTLPSCTKLRTYRSYKCLCVQEVYGVVLFSEEYGLQAENRVAAGADCNDIESRVNNYNKSAETDIRVNCRLQ